MWMDDDAYRKAVQRGANFICTVAGDDEHFCEACGERNFGEVADERTAVPW